MQEQDKPAEWYDWLYECTFRVFDDDAPEDGRQLRLAATTYSPENGEHLLFEYKERDE
jgi:hypothetical protein